jgi:CBS domain-containing protein
MGNRYPEGSVRDDGTVGGVEAYGPERRGEGTTARGSSERGGGPPEESGRYYRAALSRSPESREEDGSRRTGSRHERSWRGSEQRGNGGDGWRGGERWGRGEDWRGAERFEHGRAGFDDFGTPSYGQGRELRERHSDRDFEGRDDRYAGRSGMGYSAESTDERARDRDYGRERRRGRLWEREPAMARDIMTPNPKAVRRDATLRDVAQIMRDENCGVVPVVDDNQRLIGLITDRDTVMRTFTEQKPWTAFKAGDVMTDEVDAVTPDTPVREIIQLMGRKQVRRVPVVDRSDRLAGVISMADVATRANEDEDLQEALDRISKRRSFWSRLWS